MGPRFISWVTAVFIIIGSLWWAFLSSTIIYTCNYLFKKVNIRSVKLYGKAALLLYSVILISTSAFLITNTIRNYEPKINGSLANYVNGEETVPIYIWLGYDNLRNMSDDIDRDADIRSVTTTVGNLGGTITAINDNAYNGVMIWAKLSGTKLKLLAQIEQITYISLNHGR